MCRTLFRRGWAGAGVRGHEPVTRGHPRLDVGRRPRTSAGRPGQGLANRAPPDVGRRHRPARPNRTGPGGTRRAIGGPLVPERPPCPMLSCASWPALPRTRRPRMTCLSSTKRRPVAHSGESGHLFRLKADTVPAESGQVRGQAVPVVAVRLSSGPRHTPGPPDRLHGPPQAGGPPPLANRRDRPPLRCNGMFSLAPALRRRQAAWRHAGSQKRRLEPTGGL